MGETLPSRVSLVQGVGDGFKGVGEALTEPLSDPEWVPMGEMVRVVVEVGDMDGVTTEDATLPAIVAVTWDEREEDVEEDTATEGVLIPLLEGERRGEREVVEEREGDLLPLPLPLSLPLTVTEAENNEVGEKVGESTADGEEVAKGVVKADWVEDVEGVTPPSEGVKLGVGVLTSKVALNKGVKVMVMSEEGEGDTEGVLERDAERVAFIDPVESAWEK